LFDAVIFSELSDVRSFTLDNFQAQNDNETQITDGDHLQREISSKESPMSSALDGKRVLLVDDDNDILTSMQAALEPTGAVIDTANNGNKAVELAEKNQPDLVILDMMLPGRSGFLVLEKIKARKPLNSKPYVIMITGNQGARHKMYAESLGVSDYFNKPVKLDKLIARAEQLMAPPAAAP
jgi:CheY-like chemotaxis protein